MKRTLSLMLTAAATIGAAREPVPTPAPVAGETADAASASIAKLPGFAAALLKMPAITGPGDWRVVADEAAWGAIASSRPETRQAARWNYARSLLAGERGAEAIGVLDVMAQDDPDLALVPAWRLARGAALAQAGRGRAALDALDAPALGDNAEACLWRTLAMVEAKFAREALAQVRCALPALNARPGAKRTRFVLAVSGAAIAAGRPAAAVQWLDALPAQDPAADLLRGKALLALGQARGGQAELKQVALHGTAEQRIDAELSTIESAVAGGAIRPAAVAKRLDRVLFTWRGGDVEERALRLAWQLATRTGDSPRALAAGATLFRYFPLGAETATMAAALHAQLDAALAPDSKMPIGDAAGLYWDYRDLAPAGADGDRLVGRLADRLAGAGLYARAAELLTYQLTARVQDIAKGPLSVKVATLHILAGRPDQALRVLRDTDRVAYPDEMLWDRHRIGAAALHLLGRTAEAFAALQDVPDGGRIAAEIHWRNEDWVGLTAAGEPSFPAGPLGEVGQVVVLRHAIALAMLGREEDLARLRARYATGFSGAPSASAFDVLTATADAIDPTAIGSALAALPSASPVGRIGDLLDAEVAASERPRA